MRSVVKTRIISTAVRCGRSELPSQLDVAFGADRFLRLSLFDYTRTISIQIMACGFVKSIYRLHMMCAEK